MLRVRQFVINSCRGRAPVRLNPYCVGTTQCGYTAAMQTSGIVRKTESDVLARIRPRPALQRVAEVVSVVSRDGAVWMACSVVLRSSGNVRCRDAASDGFLAWAASEVVTFGVKRVVRRPRPQLEGNGPTPKSTSMPSSHTASAVAYTVAAGARLPVAALPLGAIAAVVAWSRLATQRHFPTDIFVGALIGTTVGGAISRLRSTYRR
jgi:membrane-associated phospholipid phosphatase